MAAINCQGCNATIESPSSFCPECGGELEYDVCPQCESPLPDGADRCEECGHDIVTTADEDVVAGPFRGPEVDDADEAIREADADLRGIVSELLQRDPDLIRAYGYHLSLAEPPYGVPEDAPKSQQQLYEIVEGSGIKKSVSRLTREFTEDADTGPDAPSEANEEWVRAQMEELVGYGAIGRYETSSETKYGELSEVLSDTLSMSANTLEDIDECVSDTGLPRDLVLYRVLDASMSYLDLSEYGDIAAEAGSDD